MIAMAVHMWRNGHKLPPTRNWGTEIMYMQFMSCCTESNSPGYCCRHSILGGYTCSWMSGQSPKA
jgi:hypothetical protein